MDDSLCVSDCTDCPRLVDSRSQIVNGVGPTDAQLVFVGEGPGDNEDEAGEPFVGRSGTVLDDALDNAGLAREAVRITNSVRCRPPETATPSVRVPDFTRSLVFDILEFVQQFVVGRPDLELYVPLVCDIAGVDRVVVREVRIQLLVLLFGFVVAPEAHVHISCRFSVKKARVRATLTPDC